MLTDKKAEQNEVRRYPNHRWDLVCTFLSTMFASSCVISFDNSLLSLTYSASSLLLNFRSLFFQEDSLPDLGILTPILIEPHEIKTRLEMVSCQSTKFTSLPIPCLKKKFFLNITIDRTIYFSYEYILLSNIYFLKIHLFTYLERVQAGGEKPKQTPH